MVCVCVRAHCWTERALMVIFLPGCRVMVSESYDQQEVEKTMMYYSTPLVKESDFPFNFYLLDLPQNHSGLWLHSLVDLWMANMPEGLWANWVVRPDPYLTLSPGLRAEPEPKDAAVLRLMNQSN